MNPRDYFPKLYQEDLKVFLNKEATGKGPQWMLCGMTMGNILEPQNRPQYKSVNDFIVVLYELNLLNQGIHCHFYEDFYAWCETSIPFPDCQACASCHGGISRPYSIIKFVKDPSYVTGAKPVSISQRTLKDYTQYFFKDYIKKIEDTGKFMSVTSEKLIKALKNDNDCLEFRRLIVSSIRRREALASRPRPKIRRKGKSGKRPDNSTPKKSNQLPLKFSEK